MSRKTIATEAAAPLLAVFRIYTDIGALSQRIESIENVTLLTPEPMQVGTQWEETRTIFGQTATEVMEVTEFVQNERYTVEAESCGTHYKTTFRFEATDNGTRITMEFEALPLTTSAKVLSFVLSPFVSGQMMKLLEADMEALNRVAESSMDITDSDR